MITLDIEYRLEKLFKTYENAVVWDDESLLVQDPYHATTFDLVRESPPQLIKAHASTAQSVSSNADANHARRDCELPNTIPVGRPSPSSTSAHCDPAHRTRVLVSTIGVANCTVCNILLQTSVLVRVRHRF